MQSPSLRRQESCPSSLHGRFNSRELLPQANGSISNSNDPIRLQRRPSVQSQSSTDSEMSSFQWDDSNAGVFRFSPSPPPRGRSFRRSSSYIRPVASHSPRTPRLSNIISGGLIGRGTFGDVHRGMDLRTGIQYAIKRSRGNVDEQQARALRSEIQVMQELRHPNIVRYFGILFHEADESLDIFLELVPGGSLADLIRDHGSLGFSLVRKFAFHMLQGISYLHREKVIHRDIKGANVLVSLDGTCKLADFGCSKMLSMMDTAERNRTLQRLCGSIPWMAPEIIKETGYGLSADIWSFGATVLEISSGQRPWPNMKEQVSGMFQIANTLTGPPIHGKITSMLREFITLCFRINPNERPSAAQLLEEEIFMDLPSPM